MVAKTLLNRAKKPIIDAQVERMGKLVPLRPLDDDPFGPSLKLLDPVLHKEAAETIRWERRKQVDKWSRELVGIESMVNSEEVKEVRRLAHRAGSTQ
jgi:hypothetical protein